jgi:Na+-transporting methylmalonyl-CoA/oxaloacetate decarboxylase gamma subunit
MNGIIWVNDILGGYVMLTLSLQLMMYGLIGVFSALAILFFAVKGMTRIFPCDTKKRK